MTVVSQSRQTNLRESCTNSPAVLQMPALSSRSCASPPSLSRTSTSSSPHRRRRPSERRRARPATGPLPEPLVLAEPHGRLLHLPAAPHLPCHPELPPRQQYRSYPRRVGQA